MDMIQQIREAQGTYIELVLLDARGHRPLAEGELSPEARHGAKNWMQAHGLAGEENLAGQYHLTYDGELLADALQASRADGEGRWDRVTRETIAAIQAGRQPDDVTVVDGVPVSERERQLAIDRLERWRLIKALRAWGGQVVRALPLPALAETVGIVGPLKDHYEGRGYVDQSVRNTTNISGGNVAGVQTGGSGNTMHVTQHISALERAGIASKVDSILQVLAGVDGADGVRKSVEEIREVAILPGATKPTVKQKVIEAMTIAGGTAGVVQATVMLAQLLPMLG